jgi:hypothetical protein
MSDGALEAEMIRRRSDRGWILPGLGADGPVPSRKRELRLFGQFVGDWQIFPGPTVADPARPAGPDGEVHGRWVLGGLGTQDVWGPVDPRSGRFVPQGSTIRFYDRGLRAWRSTWLSPYQRSARRFIGREQGDEIVLRELDRGWRGERWIFSDIGRSVFRWRAETRTTPHGARRITEDYWIRRTTSGGR